MRYLVISDVHGNRFGLEAVLGRAHGRFDRILCLGDVVGYGADPNRCCEILRENGAHSLLGNHDAAALGQIDISWFNPVATEAILWTRRELSPSNTQWLQSLKPRFESAEHGFDAVHASLRQPLEEYIIDARIAQATLALCSRQICFYGHTHVAETYRSASGPNARYAFEHGFLTHGGALEMGEFTPHSWQYLLNPGSCGQPRDGNPQARYALFDSDLRTIEIRAIDYDWQAARDAIFEAGLPHLLGERLGQGR